MKKKLKVNDALSIGRKMILFPVALVVFGSMGTAFYFIAQRQAPGAMLFIGCLASFVFGWICWRLMVIWWKSWAFPHVKNEYQLKKRAAQEYLLWPSVGFFTKAKPEFEKPDSLVLTEPAKIPKETLVFYSKSKNFAQMNSLLFFTGISAFLFLYGSNGFPLNGYPLAFSTIVCAILSYVEYSEAVNMQPQIRISNSGIWTKNVGFKPWEEITHAEVSTVANKKSLNFLAYDYSDGSESIQIDDFNVEPWQLELILMEYRKRHKTA